MQPNHSVTSILDSRVESVDIGEEFVRNFLSDAGFNEEDQYFIGLAAREILINAIKHGNRFDRQKVVTVQLTMRGDSVTIEVADDGDGFRLENVPDPRAAENQERRSGRGLAIALAIMDEFSVDKNQPNGTHVRMVKTLRDSSGGGTSL